MVNDLLAILNCLQFGSDRIKVIDTAKPLNLEFMLGADLVGAVMSASSESFATFLDKYEADVLPPREQAKSLGSFAQVFRRSETRKGIKPLSA